MSPTWRPSERPDLVADVFGAPTNAGTEGPSRLITRALSMQPSAQPQCSLRHVGPHCCGDSRQNRCLQCSRTQGKRPPPPHEPDQAGSAFNNDSAARVEAVVLPARRTISSATDVTYAASVKLLNFASRLDRAPSNPACKSATAS
jgi:hypothetical protein